MQSEFINQQEAFLEANKWICVGTDELGQTRWRDPESEIWKDVVGYEGFYQVSNNGCVQSIDRKIATRRGGTKYLAGRILKPFLNRTNSTANLAVALSKDAVVKTKSVHVLVLEAFVGPRPNGMEGCHFPDPSHLNNRLDNLRWGTYEENRADMVLQGTAHLWGKEETKFNSESTKGEKNNKAILTEGSVREIRRRYKTGGVTHKQLAIEFGVCEASVQHLIKRTTWTHVADNEQETTA